MLSSVVEPWHFDTDPDPDPPYGLMDPDTDSDPDPAFFVSCWQDANKK
jgi:hypothetical protein